MPSERLSEDRIKELMDHQPAHPLETLSLAREVMELRRDSRRLDWLCEDSHIALSDSMWDAAAKICPLDWDEACDTEKWVRAAIDAAMQGKPAAG